MAPIHILTSRKPLVNFLTNGPYDLTSGHPFP